jgi:hypothetical protein
MPLSIDATATAAIASRERGVAALVELDFTGGLTRLTTWPVPVVAGGNTFASVAGLASIGEIRESADASDQTMTLTLSLANQAMLAASVGDPAVYRGRRASVWLQFFNGTTYQPAGAAVLIYRGVMDQTRVRRTKARDDGTGQVGTIELTLKRSGISRSRMFQGLRLTQEQWAQRYPSSTGLRYIADLRERPVVWLSRRFQEAGV